MLDAAEGTIDDGAEHLAVPLAAHHAVAVLARQGAAELQHQVGHVLGDAPHPGDLGGVLQVEHRPQMQAADAGMAVEGAVGAMRLEQFAEAGDELRQPCRLDRRVLDEGDRLAVAGDAVQQTRRRARGPPTAGRAPPGPATGTSASMPSTAAQPLPQFFDAVGDLGRIVAAELDHAAASPARRRSVPSHPAATGWPATARSAFCRVTRPPTGEIPGREPAPPSRRPARRNEPPAGRVPSGAGSTPSSASVTIARVPSPPMTS